MKNRTGYVLALLCSLGVLLLSRCVIGEEDQKNGNDEVTIPANVNATPLGPDSIYISWSGINGAERYNIYRSTSSTGIFEGLFYVTETHYTDTELSPNTTYYYKVSAVKEGAESLYSTAASAKTFTNNTEQVPAPPLGLNAVSLSSTSIVISWNPVGNALNYRLYRKNSGGSFELIATPVSNSHTDTGLSPSTAYYYKVAAANGSGEGAQSGEALAMTLAAGAGTAPGAAPTGLTATVTANSITLSWNSVTGALTYLVYRGSSSSGPWEIKGTPTAASYTDGGLSSGTTYYYKVAGVNNGGEGPHSEVYSAATQGAGGGLPAAPVTVNAAALSSGAIEISWTTVSGAASYRVYRSTDAVNFTLVGFPSGLSYTDGGLSSSTTYYYRVSAVNGSGEGPQSQIASAVTSGDGGGYPPQAPTGLKIASPSPSGIGLSWNSVSGASSYKVFRTNSANGNYGLISTTGNVSYTDTSITGGASYYYKVSAVNGNGESPRSAPAFGFAVAYYELPYHSSKQIMTMTAGGKHYYRLAVTTGNSYTIEWQTGWYNDGSTVTGASGAANSVYVTAWQNDGTGIFTDQSNGFTSPKTFTAGSSGYVTVEVKQYGSFTGTYAIYYYQN
jgi:fibronectin type 3 domain-containing protein